MPKPAVAREEKRRRERERGVLMVVIMVVVESVSGVLSARGMEMDGPTPAVSK